MPLFSLSQEIAIDLGTANTIIISNGEIVVDEPSVIALRQSDNTVLEVGKEANKMIGRGSEDKVLTIRPLKNGVIANYKACELMIRGFINMIPHRRRVFSPSIKMVVCVPSGATEAEKLVIRDSCTHAGARELHLIYEPMAAAMGMGFDINSPNGCMVVDIGGGTTEIAVMSLGALVVNESIPVAGDALNQDIMQHMEKNHGIKIGEPKAEMIKMQVGSALLELATPPQDIIISGKNKANDLPLTVPVSYQEIAHCIDKNITTIENAILSALRKTPPELYSDIVENGVYLTGGGALLRGLAERLSRKFIIDFHVSEDPLHSVAIGTGIALKNMSDFNFLF